MRSGIIKKITISTLTSLMLTSPAVVSFASYAYETKERSLVSPLRIIVCLAIGLVAALIITSIMKSKLNSVHRNDYADNYIDSNSFDLDVSLDLFQYDRVEKTRIVSSDDDD